MFFVIMETLQNVVKHSGASDVNIKMYVKDDGFLLIMDANNKRIDFNNLRPFCNKIKNMQKRMKDVAINFSIENNHGTIVRL